MYIPLKYRRMGCIICVSLLVFVPVLLCSVDSYMRARSSARDYLARLTDVPDASVNLTNARLALLQRLPIGTSSANVVAFLEQHGIERDRFVGGQFMRYQIQSEHTILGLLSDSPPLIAFPCSGTAYLIRFLFDDGQQVDDIGIEVQSVCL